MKSLIVFSTLMLFCSIGYTQQKNDAHVNADYFLFDKKGNKISAAYSYISEINEQGYAIFAKGGNYIENPYGQIPNAKYGIIHESGKIIVPAQYDYLDPITTGDSIFITTLNEKDGLIHQNGTILLQTTYAQINTMYDVEGMLEAKLSDNIYRLIDFNGKSLTKTYQSINSTDDGFIVQDQGYYGLINNQFKDVFPSKYADIEALDGGLFLVTDKFLKQCIIDITGKKKSDSFDELEKVYDDNYNTIGFILTNKGKEGFIDANGNQLIAPSVTNLTKIDMGCDSYLFSYTDKNGKYGLLDANGKKLGKAVYSSLNTSSYFGKYLIVGFEKKAKKKSKKKNSGEFDDWGYFDYPESNYGLVDATGKLVLKAEYSDYGGGYYGQDLIVLKKGSEWIALDASLKPLFKQQLSYIESIGDNFKVQIGGVDKGYGTPEGGVFGVYDKNGKEIIPIQYEDIQENGYEYNSGYLIKKNGRYGICSNTGTILLEPTYTAMNCQGDLCITSQFIEQSEQTKMGLYNKNSMKELVPPTMDYIESLSYESTFIFESSSKFGVLNSKGKVLLPAKYNFLKTTNLYDKDEWLMANAYGDVTKNEYGTEVNGGNWGIINMNGDTILPFKFKEIDFVNDSIANLLDYDGKAYLMNINSMTTLTNPEANYISQISYDWQNPTYLIGKDVVRGEYGDATGGTYGLIDGTGKELIPFSYSEIKQEGDFYIANSIDFNGFDLLSESGKVIVNRAKSIQPLNDSLFLILNENKGYIYNANQKVKHSSDEFSDFATPEYFSTYGNIFIGAQVGSNLWGIINRQGEMIIKPQFCDVKASDEAYIIVAKCGTPGEAYKYGVIDLMNNILIPFEYEAIEASYGGKFTCTKDKTEYTVTLANEILDKKPASEE